jgi:hypothetical protein
MEGPMMRWMIASLLGLLMVGTWAAAQAPAAARLRWTPGQRLFYRVEVSTSSFDQVGEGRTQTRSVVKVIKRWQVQSVDSAGVATLQLALTAMSQERTTASGDVLRYDSANPAKSTPEMKAALGQFLDTTLAVIRVDSQGRVVEIKESKSPASSYEHELPFVVVLPAQALKVGTTWERPYQITLAPPLGTGEKYAAVQRYTVKNVNADSVTLALTTALKSPPKAPADAIPLWQMLPQGEVVVDLKNGRLHSARLTVDRELKGHQGKDSVCRYQSTQTIQYVGP